MKTLAAIALLALAARAAEPAAPPILLGIAGRPALPAPTFALVSGENATLRILPENTPATAEATATPRLFQVAGAVARPLETQITVEPDSAEPRALLLRFTVPDVKRPSRLALRLGDSPSLVFTALPASPRRDRTSLVDALETSRLRLLVCGRSRELRDWLRAEKLDFADEGVDPPSRVPADTLLLGTMNAEDWKRISRPGATPGRVLAFVDEPALLPGVYAEPSARHAKITLPLLASLPTDPLARETLHTLLFRALAPAPLEQ
jgi:hypothetical protein